MPKEVWFIVEQQKPLKRDKVFDIVFPYKL